MKSNMQRKREKVVTVAPKWFRFGCILNNCLIVTQSVRQLNMHRFTYLCRVLGWIPWLRFLFHLFFLSNGPNHCVFYLLFIYLFYCKLGANSMWWLQSKIVVIYWDTILPQSVQISGIILSTLILRERLILSLWFREKGKKYRPLDFLWLTLKSSADGRRWHLVHFLKILLMRSVQMDKIQRLC